MMNLLKSIVFAVFDIPSLKDRADIFKLRADQVKDKNPADENGRQTLLHWARKVHCKRHNV